MVVAVGSAGHRPAEHMLAVLLQKQVIHFLSLCTCLRVNKPVGGVGNCRDIGILLGRTEAQGQFFHHILICAEALDGPRSYAKRVAVSGSDAAYAHRDLLVKCPDAQHISVIVYAYVPCVRATSHILVKTEHDFKVSFFDSGSTVLRYCLEQFRGLFRLRRIDFTSAGNQQRQGCENIEQAFHNRLIGTWRKFHPPPG